MSGAYQLQQVTLDAIAAECIRASVLHPRNHFANVAMPRGEKLAALGEEFGEVCRALTYDVGDRVNLIKELIQVAASAAAWVEAEERLLAMKDRQTFREEQARQSAATDAAAN